MKFVQNTLVVLVAATILSGCEIIDEFSFSGFLQPPSPAQIEALEAIPNVDSTGSGPNLGIDSEPLTPRIASASNVRLSVMSQCLDTDNGISKPAESGSTLVIDDLEYTVVEVWCGVPNDDASSVTTIDGADLTVFRLVESTFTARAEAVDPQSSEPEQVSISVWTFVDDAADFGSQFAPIAGVKIFGLNAVDTNENIASGLLIDGPPPSRPAIQQAQQDLNALISGTNGRTARILQRAANSLVRAGNDRLWSSDGELATRNGRSAFSHVASAVNNIEKIADTTADNGLMVALDAITDSLLDTTRMLADQRLAAATAAGADDHALFRSNRALEHGDASRAQDQLRYATQRYGRAWKIANRLLR